MKRILALLLAALLMLSLAFSLTACGDGDDSGNVGANVPGNNANNNNNSNNNNYNNNNNNSGNNGGYNDGLIDVTDAFSSTRQMSVKSIRRDDRAGVYYLSVEKDGYNAPIRMTVGVTFGGVVTGVTINEQHETHGRPGMDAFLGSFPGTTAETVDTVETVTAATYTSRVIKDGVKDALISLGFMEHEAVEPTPTPTPTPRTDDEIMALAEETYSWRGELSFVEFPKDANGYVRKVMIGPLDAYAVYVCVYSQYGQLTGEAIVAFDGLKSITAVRKLTWYVGYEDYNFGIDAPSPETVDAFFQSFVGKTASDVSSVETVTGATGTSGLIREAIKAACEVVCEVGSGLPALPIEPDDFLG